MAIALDRPTLITPGLKPGRDQDRKSVV